MEVTDPEWKRPLTLGEAAAAQSFQLTEAGYYQLHLANGRQNEVGVNPDPKESNLDVIPDDVLALWQGNGGQSTQEARATGSVNAPAPQEIPEKWRFVALRQAELYGNRKRARAWMVGKWPGQVDFGRRPTIGD